MTTIFGEIVSCHFRLLFAILYIPQTVSPAVGRGRVRDASFVTPFRLLNDVSICNNNEVISIFGYAAMLALTVENTLPNVSVGQMLPY